MDITLCRYTGPDNSIAKELGSGNTLSGTLKAGSSVTDPVILVEIANPATYNYCKIGPFNRYYYIRDIINVRNGLWELHMHVDVLMSFRNGIRNSMAIVTESSEIGVDDYLPNDIWKTTAKDLTDVIEFPNGLLENGEYILITAGGIVS